MSTEKENHGKDRDIMLYCMQPCKGRKGEAMGEKKGLAMDLQQWGSALSGCALPAWQDFPELPLYMDQVIYLLNHFLQGPLDPKGENQITPSMINNYVKLKIIPAPIKKRYGRAHLAYLTMVCLLKQSMSTADIRRLLPLNGDEDTVRDQYAAFCFAFRGAKEDFLRENKSAFDQTEDENAARQAVFSAAAKAQLNMLLCALLLPGEENPERSHETGKG